MNNPILSICIATYNRELFIEDTLKTIIPQLTNDVEIVIVDGASTDNTSIIIQKYIQISDKIRYFKLDKKGGVDFDYCKAVELALGKMVWLFTDDDLLNPFAIEKVLNQINLNYGLILVNSSVLNKDLSNIISSNLLKLDSNEVYKPDNLEPLFERTIKYVSFIGCVIIDRKFWLQRNKENFIGSEFIHIGVIFQAPLPFKTLLIAEPLISIRYGNAQWSTRAFEIGIIKWHNLLMSLDNISFENRKKYSMHDSKDKIKRLIIYRACKQYSLVEYLLWIKKEKLRFSIYIIAFLILLLPKKILNFSVLTYIRIFDKDNSVIIYDLRNC